MKKTAFLGIATLFALGLVPVAFGVTVSDVSARQRWPWNGLIDVDFTLGDAAAGDLFRVEVSAAYAGGAKRVTGRTYLGEPLCGRGANRVTWDFGADCPNLKAADLQVAVTAAPINAETVDVYMVIDLSSGPSSTRYPVRYTFTPPVLVPTNDLVACSADPNRTTKLWLKRVKENTFPFRGTDTSGGVGWFNARLTPYYIGLFEVTQKQWALVMNTWPSRFTNVTYRAARPVERVDYTDVIGHNNWPDNKTVATDSFVGRVRARTGLTTFNLPTEAQWECACRAGYTKSINPGIKYATNVRCASLIGSHTYDYNEDLTYGTGAVGMYAPNAWGFYDFYGNVMEMCLDAFGSETTLKALYEGQDPVTDPIGPPTNATARYHATRGGAYYSSDSFCTNYQRDYGNRSETGTRNGGIGLRVAVSPEWE